MPGSLDVAPDWRYWWYGGVAVSVVIVTLAPAMCAVCRWLVIRHLQGKCWGPGTWNPTSHHPHQQVGEWRAGELATGGKTFPLPWLTTHLRSRAAGRWLGPLHISSPCFRLHTSLASTKQYTVWDGCNTWISELKCTPHTFSILYEGSVLNDVLLVAGCKNS